MEKSGLAEAILKFNSGRDPRRLKLKYRAMRENAFVFLRGTCHLFYRDLPRDGVLARAPAAWLSGDLHFENFGSYKGDNRLTYFDVNDFDEACLGACTYDLLRYLISLLVGASTLKVNEPEALALCRCGLDAYRGEIIAGKARWVERPLARGMVKELLQALKKRDQKDFLDKRTEWRRGGRRLRIGRGKFLETDESSRKKVKDALQAFAKTQERPEFYEVLDMADRIAGTGSLGVDRYAVLVEGHGSPDGNFLLDVKQALPPAPAPYLATAQPRWKNEAERVTTAQHALQAIAPALLTPIVIQKEPFVLKELQPVEDRVDLSLWNGKLRRLEKAVITMGKLVAWGQIRASGWRGSALREELADFARRREWIAEITALAQGQARRVTKEWEEYSRAYDKGFFKETR